MRHCTSHLDVLHRVYNLFVVVCTIVGIWCKLAFSKNVSFNNFLPTSSEACNCIQGSGKCTSELYNAFTDADVNSKCDQMHFLVKTCACAEQQSKARHTCGD